MAQPQATRRSLRSATALALLFAAAAASPGQARPDRLWHDTTSAMIGSLTFGGRDAGDRVRAEAFCDANGAQVVFYRYQSGGPGAGAASLVIRSSQGTHRFEGRAETDAALHRTMVSAVAPIADFQAMFSHGPVTVSALGDTVSVPQVPSRLMAGFLSMCRRQVG